MPRVGSLLTPCVTKTGGRPSIKVSAAGARRHHHASVARVGPIGVAIHDVEVHAVQYRMSVLANGLCPTTRARHESARRVAARTTSSATPMLPLGHGGQCAGVDIVTKTAGPAQATRFCTMPMSSLKKPSGPTRSCGPLLTSSTASPQQTASASTRDHLEQQGKTRMRRGQALGAATGATLREKHSALTHEHVPGRIGIGATPVVASFTIMDVAGAVHAESLGERRNDVVMNAGMYAHAVRPSYSHYQYAHPPTA